MKLVGLTGGVGMGKSTCADLLKQRGVPVIDTDELARAVVEPGQPALAEVVKEFGAEMLDSNGSLRRDLLARHVFANPAARVRLESILHPRILKLWLSEVAHWRAQNLALGVVAIPLLFETHAESHLGPVVCVGCSRQTQLDRLLSRGWDEQQIQQRISAQWPIDQKISKANYVIWSEGSIAVHTAQLDRILGSLRPCREYEQLDSTEG